MLVGLADVVIIVALTLLVVMLLELPVALALLVGKALELHVDVEDDAESGIGPSPSSFWTSDEMTLDAFTADVFEI